MKFKDGITENNWKVGQQISTSASRHRIWSSFFTASWELNKEWFLITRVPRLRIKMSWLSSPLRFGLRWRGVIQEAVIGRMILKRKSMNEFSFLIILNNIMSYSIPNSNRWIWILGCSRWSYYHRQCVQVLEWLI